MPQKALITGITGQDGSYLADLLLNKGYEVHGLIRRSSTFNTHRLEHIYVDPHDPKGKFYLHYGDLNDGGQLSNLVYNIHPDEIYHLGAQSHVRVSFDMPEFTGDITGLGTTRILEAIRRSGIKPGFTRPAAVKCLATPRHPKMKRRPSGPEARMQPPRSMLTGWQKIIEKATICLPAMVFYSTTILRCAEKRLLLEKLREQL